ncbi:hypothetical protein KN200_15780 (plasmid) [Clavibacter michiganensis subsp. michiganensis]|uniref:hypothetical protein n=1 Tax=Clavibacter michiganensis TaxID=28447 RepID=UPI000B6B27FB|nr:hypothetical protein [Clavibacter michiganensis]OUE28211.1 hypothetical protein CMMCA001_02435 [Clavibacter michiganensis subsp. michiganensis]QXP07495.1 hypothetical protein KN200_15780 [Clavibacter michiganensis subsp. michiganensis]
MTEVRKSGKQSAARKAARERATEQAADFRRREAALEELAVDYFVAVDAIDEIEAEAARQIAEIRARAEAETSTARSEATGVMASMLCLLALLAVLPLLSNASLTVTVRDAILASLTVLVVTVSQIVRLACLPALGGKKLIFHSTSAGAAVGVILVSLLPVLLGLAGALLALLMAEIVVTAVQICGISMLIKRYDLRTS